VRSTGHSEIAAKLLTDLEANFHVFSEQALILQGNLSDFDSTIHDCSSEFRKPAHLAGTRRSCGELVEHAT
jgi:hypothetical protein